VNEATAGGNAFLTQTFAYSSGRVIALCRLVWAAVFLLVLWFDPQQSARDLSHAFLFLIGYVGWAAIIAALVWNHWWLDYRLSLFFHLTDIVAFLATVFLAEGVSGDFTSPFLVFFAYLILAAAIRWRWQSALTTGLIVTLLYAAVGVAICYAGLEFDIYRFSRRVTYMSLLALVMAWFALRRGEQKIAPFWPPIVEIGGDLPLQAALSYAAKHTFSRAAVIGWWDFEEPFTRVYSLGGAAARERLGPREFSPERGFGSAVRLFDRRRGRILQANEDGRVTGRRAELKEEFAASCGIDEGLAVPISSPTGRGEILLASIDGLCRDHLLLGRPLGREICSAFDRQTAISLANKMAVSHMREGIARDLHDSVVQSLAGAALRVGAMRAWIQQGGDPEPEIESVQRALREEQAQVRSLIARLRQGTVAEGSMDAASVARVLLRGLEDYWDVTVRLASLGEPVAIPTWMAHELDGILREAIANAVRHGAASEIDVELSKTAAGLTISIADNGNGFPAGSDVTPPRSISARVTELGGSLTVIPAATGVCLQASLPLEGPQ